VSYPLRVPRLDRIPVRWPEILPTGPEVINGLTMLADNLSLSGLQEVIASYPAGAKLAQMPRFAGLELFKPIDYGDAEWMDLLGAQGQDLEYYTHLYRANKYLGHFAVALRMGRLLDMQHPELADPSNKLTKGVELLNALVSCNDLGVMIDYANYFLGTQLFLDGHQDEINRALVRADGLFPDGTIPRDNQERPTTLPQLVTSWQQYQVVVPGARQATN
jgi:hypothetical protein